MYEVCTGKSFLHFKKVPKNLKKKLFVAEMLLFTCHDINVIVFFDYKPNKERVVLKIMCGYKLFLWQTVRVLQFVFVLFLQDFHSNELYTFDNIEKKTL